MYRTYEEITTQYDSLEKTLEYFKGMRDEIRKFMDAPRHKSITFLGCGSSYTICKSAETIFNTEFGLKANSFAAGDIMMNFPHYRKILQDSLLVAISRSGSTSEVVEVFKKAKGLASGFISVCAREKAPLSEIADLNLEIPWAFDESVCQTRTVTSLYTSCLLLLAAYSGNDILWTEIEAAIAGGKKLMVMNLPVLEEFTKNMDWDRVIVLADSHLSGIGEEAAIAFKEICRVHSNFYHILDVRHGPMVLVDDMTLVILACTPFEPGLHTSLIADLKSRGAKVITIGPDTKFAGNSDLHIRTDSFTSYAVSGIQFIFVPQLVSYFKAVQKGVDPDSPEGLMPWIELK